MKAKLLLVKHVTEKRYLTEWFQLNIGAFKIRFRYSEFCCEEIIEKVQKLQETPQLLSELMKSLDDLLKPFYEEIFHEYINYTTSSIKEQINDERFMI